MDAADALAAWGLHLHEDGADKLERWETPATPQAVPAAPLKRGERLRPGPFGGCAVSRRQMRSELGNLRGHQLLRAHRAALTISVC